MMRGSRENHPAEITPKETTMEVNTISIQLASENPDRLFAFYRDVVQLPLETEVGDRGLKLGPTATLFVVDHSEVTGPTKERSRAILDLHLSGLDAEHDRLKAAGVQFTREKGLEYWGGVISTFLDPDGNYCQLIEFKPTA